MRKAFYLALALAAALAISGCSGKQEVLAKAGKFKITKEDLEKSFRSPMFESADKEFEAKKQRVEKMAEDKLIISAAYDAGLDKNEAVVKALDEEAAKRNRVMKALQEVVINDKIGEITDAEVNDIYERYKTKVHAMHILVKDQKLADSLYAAISSGADWNALAAQFSQDPSNKDRGGDLGFFGPAMMVKEFEDAAYALNAGEVSKPVKTQFGFHLIKLVEKAPNEQVQPLADMKDKLKETVKRAKAQKLAQDFVEGIKSKANFQFNEQAVAVVVAKSQVPQPTDPAAPPAAPAYTPEEKALALATYAGGQITIFDIDTLMAKLPPFRKPPLTDPQVVKDFVQNMLLTTLLEKEAENMKIGESAHYKKFYKEDLDRELLKAYRKDYLNKDVEVSPDSVRAYYQANPDSFIQPELAAVYEIQLETEKEALAMIARIKKGEKIDKLAGKYTKRNYVKEKNGLIEPFPESRFPELFAAAKALKPGQLCEKPVEMGGKFSVIQLVSFQPPMPKPFEQVERQISAKLKAKNRQQEYDKWLAGAKKKYGFKVYDEKIRKTIDVKKYENKPANAAGAPPQGMPQGGMQVRPAGK